MTKKILIPTDFSEQAEHALKVAAKLAKKEHSELYLLHIIELPVHLTDLMTTSNAPAPEAIFFMKETHKKFEELMSKSYLEGIKVFETVSFKDMATGVQESCEKNNIDLIVMGSHGSTGLEELFIGSNAEKIVRSAKPPVLVIKEECNIFEINDLVYATNFEEDQHAVTAANNFAQLIGAKFHLLWVNTASSFRTTDETTKKMHALLSDLSIETPSIHIYNDANVEKGILNFAQSHQIGLISIGTHGRKGLSHFINGSLGEDVVNHAKRPVLTFKI